MYVGDWRLRLSRAARQARQAQASPGAGWRVSANVWGLGITSMLTDISSEMVVSVLPAYLVLTTGFAPLLLGIATGLHEGGPLLVTWIGGWLADRSGRRKLTALAGYALSAICRLGWLVLNPERMTALAALVLSDRMGKAIRTAPRDALISLSTPKPHPRLPAAVAVPETVRHHLLHLGGRCAPRPRRDCPAGGRNPAARRRELG